MTDTQLTGSDNYFENFEVGAVYKHARRQDGNRKRSGDHLSYGNEYGGWAF